MAHKGHKKKKIPKKVPEKTKSKNFPDLSRCRTFDEAMTEWNRSLEPEYRANRAAETNVDRSIVVNL